MAPALASPAQGAYGKAMARLIRSSHARCFTASSTHGAALTELRLDTPPPELSPPSTREDAIVTAINVGGMLHRANWIDGKAQPEEAPVPPGTVTFLDMRRVNQVRIASPLHSVQFYLPHSLLREMGGGQGDLQGIRFSMGGQDATMHQLALAALPAFQRPDEVSRLFLDQLMMAAAAHLAGTYAPGPEIRARGGLSARQKRLAIEMIEGDLDGERPLGDLAEACGLSVRHFTRAFRESMGVSPHRWMIARRIEMAKALLLHSDLPLAEVAASCHFAHQSHLTRTFTAAVGSSPGAWRRQRR